MHNDLNTYLHMKLIALDKNLHRNFHGFNFDPEQIEIEVAYGRSPNTIDFNTIKKFIKNAQLGEVSSFDEKHSLDIIYRQRPTTSYYQTQNVRFTIMGIDNVKTFCGYQSIKSEHAQILELKNELIQKSRFVQPSKIDLFANDPDATLDDASFAKLYGKQYNCRFNISNEHELEPNINILNTISNDTIMKTYRYKKRYSKTIKDSKTKNSVCRIDITITKTGVGGNFIKSNCLRGKETIELEFEFVGNKDFSERNTKGDVILNRDLLSFFNIVYGYYNILENTSHLITLNEIMNVNYNIQQLKLTKNRNTFVGYNIVPLSNDTQTFNILKQYHNEHIITYKADGERRLLYINKTFTQDKETSIFKFYLISTKSQNNVEKIAEVVVDNKFFNQYGLYQVNYLKNEPSQYIFDCEVLEDINNKLVYIFDAIVYDNRIPDEKYSFDKRYLDIIRFKYILSLLLEHVIDENDKNYNPISKINMKEYYHANYAYHYDDIYKFIEPKLDIKLKYQTIDDTKIDNSEAINEITSEKILDDKNRKHDSFKYEIVNGMMKMMFLPYLTEVMYLHSVLLEKHTLFTQLYNKIIDMDNTIADKNKIIEHYTKLYTTSKHDLNELDALSDEDKEKTPNIEAIFNKIRENIEAYYKIIGYANELIQMKTIFDNVIKTDIFELFSGLYARLYLSDTDVMPTILKYNLMRELNQNVKNDGIIIMPIVDPYPSSNFNERVKINGITIARFNHSKQIWLNQFKWKPPSKLTIDFKLILNTNEKNESEIVYELYTTDRSIKSGVGLFMPDETYNEIDVSKLKIGMNEIVKTVDDDVQIISGKVYECLFKNGKWLAYRSRFDKEYPNRRDVANNVWNLINDAVTLEHMKSYDNANKHLLNLISEQEKMSSYAISQKQQEQDIHKRSKMNSVHTGFKKMLYQYAVQLILKERMKKNRSTRINLYETASGKFGDLHNWENSGITNLFATDIDYASMKEGRRRFSRQSTISLDGYALVDLTKNIANISEALDKSVKKEEYDVMETYLKTYFIDEQNMSYFDIASCQFALHYFCENQMTFQTFINNAIMRLKVGGLFIVTVMDGKKVFNALQKNDKIEGYMKNDGEDILIWSIEKVIRYEGEWIQIRDFGQSINVFVNTIGKYHQEYLVNVENLIGLMKNYGLELKQQLNFDKLTTNKYKYINEQSLKRFSDFHTSLVFRKFK